MLKVPYGQDPYSVIGKYIRDHITAIEDIIAEIEIDGITTNQLFMADINEENYFIWNNDWYEGEKNVTLIDFYPVSEAISPSAQPERLKDDDFETIRIHLSAYKEKLCNQHRWEEAEEYQRIIDRFMSFASAQSEIIRCRDCKHYYFADNRIPQEQRYTCELDGDRWKPDDYCSFAERRTDE